MGTQSHFTFVPPRRIESSSSYYSWDGVISESGGMVLAVDAVLYYVDTIPPTPFCNILCLALFSVESR